MSTRYSGFKHHLSQAAGFTLIVLALSGTVAAAPELGSSGLFTRADVTGPDSTFVTQVMSDPDSLILTQHDSRGINLVAGFDMHGTWLFDPATGEVRAIGDQWQVFLIGHDLHRLWLAPETRWRQSGRHFVDTAGRQARFSRRRTGRPSRLALDDDEGQPLVVKFSAIAGDALFREATIETAAGDYVYSYTAVNVIAGEIAWDQPATAARIELERLHRLHRMAHLGELPAILAGSPHPLVEVAAGSVTEVAPPDLITSFRKYFETTDFADWRDRAVPLLFISGDQTLASKIVQKSVLIRSAAGTGRRDFAWLETWHRRDGAWRLIAIASTQAAEGR